MSPLTVEKILGMKWNAVCIPQTCCVDSPGPQQALWSPCWEALIGKDEHLFVHPGSDPLPTAHPFPILQSDCGKDPVACPCVGIFPGVVAPSPSSHCLHCRQDHPSCSGNQQHLLSIVKPVDETLQSVSYRSGSAKRKTKSEDKESFIWQQLYWKEVAGNSGCLWR